MLVLRIILAWRMIIPCLRRGGRILVFALVHEA